MLSEMLFYAKSLEIYTHAYKELMQVDEDETIEQLQESMRFQPQQLGSSRQYDRYGGSAPALVSPSAQQKQNLGLASPSPSNKSALDRTM